MKKKILKLFSKFSLLFCFLVLSPIITLAEFFGPCLEGEYNNGEACVPIPTGIGGFIFQVHEILNSIIPLLVALGVVYFVWGVVKYVIADSEEAKKSGKDRMIYGIIGFAVIASLWGLVNILVDTFDLDSTAPIPSPSGSTCSLAGDPKFQDLLCYITRIINDSVIPLIFALAVAMFVWGVVQFVLLNAGDEKKRTEGKQFMIWGVIALTVMLSVWGLVKILAVTFGFDITFLPEVTPPPP